MNRDRRWSVLVPLLAVLLGSCSGPVEESLAEPFADEGWAFSYDDRGRNSNPWPVARAS
jgi:hypothetical protein